MIRSNETKYFGFFVEISKEGEQLEDRRSAGASSCNSGDGTDQRVQFLMFMMMMIIIKILTEQVKRQLQGQRGDIRDNT